MSNPVCLQPNGQAKARSVGPSGNPVAKLSPFIEMLATREQAELEQRQDIEPWFNGGESHGLSVFFRMDDDVFHTYSTYARGCESLTDSYRLLDRTPYGRQEDFEDSPMGWPQRPTYG